MMDFAKTMLGVKELHDGYSSRRPKGYFILNTMVYRVFSVPEFVYIIFEYYIQRYHQLLPYFFKVRCLYAAPIDSIYMMYNLGV